MEEKKNIFDFLIHVLCMFGITMIFLMTFCLLFGEDAKEISSMFALGGKGLPVHTMAQFLLVSIIITGLRYLFFSILSKRMTEMLRLILMLLSIIAVMAIFAYLFDWFPIAMWQPWVAFLLCFAVCVIASLIVNTLRVNVENKKMEEGLARLKQQWEEEENEK